MSSSREEQLIQAYVNGDSGAYQEIHRWIQKVVDSRHWGLAHQRDDILQEVHQRLFGNLSQGRFRAGSALRTYVHQIAKYTCIEFLRKKIRASAVDLENVDLKDPNPGPEQLLASEERRRLASEALSRLPEGCRELFDLIFQRRMPYQDISRKLGVAEGTVKSRAWRCREQLMKALGTKVSSEA